VPSSLDGKNAIVRILDGGDPQIRSARNSFAKDIRFGDTGAVSEISRRTQFAHENVSVVSNASGIRIHNPGAHSAAVEIFSSNGRRIVSQQLSAKASISIPAKNLGNGMYAIRVSSMNSRRIIRNIIIRH
jgi:hypothetical protein